MSYSYMTQLFTDGMNKDVDPGALDLSSQNNVITVVADAQNMVFERGLILTRYGLGALPGPPASLPSSANLRAARMLPFAPRSNKAPIRDRAAFAITDAPKLYSLEGYQPTANVMTPTEITGPGFTQDSGYYCDSSTVNGLVMIAGNSSGLIRWDPAAGVYTIVASSPYLYVTGHLARAVAAYDLTRGATGYAQTVAWSVSGDETDWTSLGAGTNVLADCDDSITGLKVVKGMVAVARAFGFHIGVPTGQFPAVYDWRRLSGMSIGCMHPATFTVYKDTMFFMSESSIHMFDLTNIEDIGEGIYKEIISLIRQYGLLARGFISSGYSPDFQPTYNIILDSSQTLTGTPESLIPHYMFNLREKKWTRHFYVDAAHTSAWTPLAISAEYLQPAPVDPAAIPFFAVYQRVAGSAPILKQWAPSNSLDTPASFTTGQLTLGDPASDCQVERCLLVYKVPAGTPFTLTINFDWILNGVPQTQTVTITTYAAGGWDRRWFNFRGVGNMFRAQVVVAAGSPSQVLFKSLTFEYSTTGKVRT